MTATRRLLLMAGLLAPVAVRAQQTEPQTGPQPELPKEKLVIVTHDGRRHDFSVELAVTEQQQETGLMFRRFVPPDGGMLFVWPADQESTMWMKNTVSSLDMVFIEGDGTIRTIVERTTPESLAVIDSGGPVRATLELAAGTTERLDIRVGDKVETKALGNAG
jgi:uncharacterized membrane protein (UPF0127 family)